MTEINPHVFREYDIRGKAEIDFNDNAVELLGRGFGTYFLDHGEKNIVICNDNRKSSPRIKKALIKGILSTGCNVVYIGELPTPLCYFALEHLGLTGGVMITGSHNPPEENGFKISSQGGTIFGKEIIKIKNIVNQRTFAKGKGILTFYDIKDYYLECLKNKIHLERPLKIVVDAGNGTAGPVAVELFKILGCDVTGIYCDSDCSFPHHHPDPTVPENLRDLQHLVRNLGADVGLAFDGDGDRLGVVDDLGNIIYGDILQILFWREILPNNPETPVIVEVKCSQALVEEAERLGGRPFFYKTGHSLIKAKMKEIGALFTGEMSGHFFFADEYFGYDDGLYAACRLLRLLSRSNKKLSNLLSDVSRYCATPEIRLDCPDSVKKSLIENVKDRFIKEGYEVIGVDGARVIFSKGWGLLRSSNTQPVVVMRAEAIDEESLNEITAKLQETFREILEKGAC